MTASYVLYGGSHRASLFSGLTTFRFHYRDIDWVNRPFRFEAHCYLPLLQ